MSAARPPFVFRRPSAATRVAAVCVLIALAVVAAFALFGAPTRVAATGGARALPANVAPSGAGEPQDSGTSSEGQNGG